MTGTATTTCIVKMPMSAHFLLAVAAASMALRMHVAHAAVTATLPSCDACHCTPAGGVNWTCPSLPTLPDTAELRAMQHLNPMTITCNPMSGGKVCLKEVDGSDIATGEACVVELVAPSTTAVCPTEYFYRLVTVSNLTEAIATGQYVTHVGACGACSSLQDLAVLVDYPNIPSRSMGCFNRMATAGFTSPVGTQCFTELGFTPQCARVMAELQLRTNSRCDSNCGAFAIDGDGELDCDVDTCQQCMDGRFITSRLQDVAGRTFSRSGLPSQTLRQCDAISTNVQTTGVCLLAPVEILGNTTNATDTTVSLNSTDTTASSNSTNTTTTSPAPVVAPTTMTPPMVSASNATNATVTPAVAQTPPPITLPAATQPSTLPTAAPQLVISVDTVFAACRRAVDLEESVGVLANSIVSCDCVEGDPNPQCFTGDRANGNVCIPLFNACVDGGPECCGLGIRGCRNGSCRLVSRPLAKTASRVGSISAIRGRSGGQVDALLEKNQGGFRRLGNETNINNGTPGKVRGL